MPTRASRSTPARARGNRPATSEPTALPAYEAPIGALTSKAKHDLSTLPIRRDMSGLHEQLENAHKQLASIAADVNELATQQRQRMATRTAKGVSVEPQEAEAHAETLRRFQDMTGALEGEARAIVDRQARMEMQEEALRELSANVPGRGTARGVHNLRGGSSSTQMTASLMPTQTQTQTQATTGEVDDENPQEPPAVSLVENMRNAITEAEGKYTDLSMRERYSAHNSYVNFRRMLHSAQYPDDAAAPPVPHASTWFNEATGSPQHLGPNTQDSSGAAKSEAGMPPPGTQPEAEMDSDIEAVAERTSIRCPLTLLPMKEPVTSARCPHSFEKQAIYEIINRAGRPARGEPKQAKCPVCEVMLTLDDLHPDPTLQRKIARIQAAEARRAAAGGEDDDDDDDDDDGQGPNGRCGLRPEHITSSSPVQTPRSTRAVRMKRERLSGVPR